MPVHSLDDLGANPALVSSLSAEVAAAFLQQLAWLGAALLARLIQASVASQPHAPDRDGAISIQDAAERLNTSPDSLYRKWRKLPFAYKDPLDRRLKFSLRGIERYIAQRTGSRVR